MPPKKPDVLSVFRGKITRNLSLDRVKLLMASKRGQGHIEAALDELLECIPSEDYADRIIDDMELTELLNGFLSDLTMQNRIIFMQRYWHMHQEVRMTRYLTIVTPYHEIDRLKYTAVSGMFYEFDGIAYEPLSEADAQSMRDMLGMHR